MTLSNIPIDGFKAQARRLREDLTRKGKPVSHSEALELVAHQHGARDWNTLRARAAQTAPLAVGDRVSGTYLGQPFSGQVLGLVRAVQSRLSRITITFDDPVDVVTFESFSSFRSRVSATIGEDGRSLAKTSNGVAHLIVSRA